MKYKMMALILALTVMTWAQTATQTTPPAPQPGTEQVDKDKCPCCDKMGATNTKDAHASHMHHDMSAKDGKGMASCCGDKDAMSCMKGDKDKPTDSCCGGKDAKSCMQGDKDKTAASCCGDKCGKDKTASACCGGKDCEKGCCSAKTEKTAKNCCERKLHGLN
jgi:hypothetical protein